MNHPPHRTARILVIALCLLPFPALSLTAQEGITGPSPLDSTARIEVRNLGDVVNSDAIDYAPAISPDGRTLYFASGREGGAGRHDIWTATISATSGSTFTAPQPLPAPINSDLDEGGMTMARDGRTFYCTVCNREDGVGDCDIYEGVMEGGRVMEFRSLRDVNSRFWDSQPAITPDGSALYFASNRSEGSKSGNIDIFVSTRRPDGRWGTPVRLGAPVNSAGRDESPCITLDGKLLLFTSNRDGGEGGFDIYASRLGTAGTWGTPQNLGPLFNTDRDERSVSTTPNCEVIYFSSKRKDLNTQGDSDLFMARKIVNEK